MKRTLACHLAQTDLDSDAPTQSLLKAAQLVKRVLQNLHHKQHFHTVQYKISGACLPKLRTCVRLMEKKRLPPPKTWVMACTASIS